MGRRERRREENNKSCQFLVFPVCLFSPLFLKCTILSDYESSSSSVFDVVWRRGNPNVILGSCNLSLEWMKESFFDSLTSRNRPRDSDSLTNNTTKGWIWITDTCRDHQEKALYFLFWKIEESAHHGILLREQEDEDYDDAWDDDDDTVRIVEWMNAKRFLFSICILLQLQFFCDQSDQRVVFGVVLRASMASCWSGEYCNIRFILFPLSSSSLSIFSSCQDQSQDERLIRSRMREKVNVILGVIWWFPFSLGFGSSCSRWMSQGWNWSGWREVGWCFRSQRAISGSSRSGAICGDGIQVNPGFDQKRSQSNESRRSGDPSKGN